MTRLLVDKQLWTNFVKDAKNRGHEIVFVTFRHENRGDENRDIIEDANTLGIKIIFSNYEPKSTVYKADIWIDDRPEFINF
jgi:acid phosphatase class B